jgi:hypothetical protein
MANREVGIKITAKDLTGKAFKSIGVASSKAAKAINAIPSAAGRAMKAFAIMSTGVNQAFELWAKVRERIVTAVKDAADASLKFRAATDPMRKWWEGQIKGIDLVKARIGDILLPVLKGLSDAYAELSDGADEWLKQNRKLVASRLLDWMVTFIRLGSNLVKVLGWIPKTILGIRGAFEVVLLAINKFIQTALQETGELIKVFAKVADMVGADGMGKSLHEAAQAAWEWGGVFGETADKNMESIESIGAGIDAVTVGTEAASQAMRTFADSAEKAGRSAIAKDRGAGGTREGGPAAAGGELFGPPLPLAMQMADQYMALETKITGYKQEQINYRRDMEIKASNESMAMWEEQGESAGQTMAAITESMGNTFGAMIEQTGSVDKAMKGLFKSLISQGIAAAQRMISIYAAEAAALAFKGQLGIPVVGVALGAAAAATAFGMVGAWANKMALGGEIRGGVPGRDSVPALLMPGERVLSRSENERMKGGGQEPVQQSITIAPVVQSQLPPSAEQRRAIVADLAPMIEEAVRDGQLRLGGA